MEKCYEYFGCKKTECIVYKNLSDKPCWETEGTLCFFEPIQVIDDTNEKAKCDFCLYRNTYDKNNVSLDNGL